MAARVTGNGGSTQPSFMHFLYMEHLWKKLDFLKFTDYVQFSKEPQRKYALALLQKKVTEFNGEPALQEQVDALKKQWQLIHNKIHLKQYPEKIALQNFETALANLKEEYLKIEQNKILCEKMEQKFKKPSSKRDSFPIMLKTFINTLSKEEKELFFLKAYENHSIDVISTILEMNPFTEHNLLRRKDLFPIILDLVLQSLQVIKEEKRSSHFYWLLENNLLLKFDAAFLEKIVQESFINFPQIVMHYEVILSLLTTVGKMKRFDIVLSQLNKRGDEAAVQEIINKIIIDHCTQDMVAENFLFSIFTYCPNVFISLEILEKAKQKAADKGQAKSVNLFDNYIHERKKLRNIKISVIVITIIMLCAALSIGIHKKNNYI